MITIAMPAFNVEKYVADAIDSIIKQTYTDWELVIVDDCSKDNTVRIIEEYKKKYPQIKLIKRDKNSGGCRLPRFDAILAAKGEFVCPIDSDDTIEPEYLEKLIKRQTETSAEIVLSRMIVCNEHLSPNGKTIPTQDYPIRTIFTGKEACKKTIGGWELGMNGLLAKTGLYQKYINGVYEASYNGAYADEIDHRRLLLCAKKVSMTDAKYFYRQQPTSIVHSVSAQSYNGLITNQELLRFVINNFTEESILQKVYNEYITNLYRAQQKLCLHYTAYSKAEINHIKNLIKEHYIYIKSKDIKFTDCRNKLLASSYTIFRLYSIVLSLLIRITK